MSRKTPHKERKLPDEVVFMYRDAKAKKHEEWSMSCNLLGMKHVVSDISSHSVHWQKP